MSDEQWDWRCEHGEWFYGHYKIVPLSANEFLLMREYAHRMYKPIHEKSMYQSLDDAKRGAREHLAALGVELKGE